MTEQKPKPDHFEKALDWETSRTEQLERSERTAWLVAKVASGMAILAIVAVVLMLPLKESVPYLVRVDKNTGHTDIVTVLDTKKVSIDEVIDKYWLAKFVRARESWEWYTAQEDYDNVRLLSSPEVGRDYARLFEGPNALDKQYGQGAVVTVEIRSVVPHGNGQASVRFDKKIKARDSGDAGAQISTWVATVGYEYKKVSKMKEDERLKNPLGFQAMSYRVDSEITRQAAPVAAPDQVAPAPVVPALIPK
jgi:type IV secretory pathway component VirB8